MRSAVLALLTVLAMAFGAAPASASPATAPVDEPPALCQVTGKANTWSGGYIMDITIKNTSSRTVTWEAKLILAGNTVTVYWDATFTRTTDGFTITPAKHNGVLAPGGTARFGYSGAGSPPLPTVTCKPII